MCCSREASSSTVGEPAYFHGGNAEKIFQQQLDHQIGDEMSKSNAGDLAAAMFRRQFPKEAELISAADKKAAASLSDLSSLLDNDDKDRLSDLSPKRGPEPAVDGISAIEWEGLVNTFRNTLERLAGRVTGWKGDTGDWRQLK